MNVTREIVERLSRYRSVLFRLRSLGFVKVFSDNLGDALGISSSQVRKDFAAFGIRGVKRGGYHIEEVVNRLDELLGPQQLLKVIVVGCGNIGTALIRSYGQRREGICVVAGFDVDPEIVGEINEVPVFDVRELAGYVRREEIPVAVLSVPEEAATDVMNQLLEGGIQGVLNFTPAQLRGNETCVVHHLNIRMEIEKLFYLVHFTRRNGAFGLNDGEVE